MVALHPGRHFLQIPGPTNVPDRVLHATALPTIDHRGPEFAELVLDLLPALARVFQTHNPVVIYPASGTGACQAALVNVLSPGDRVLAFDSGHFARLWAGLAEQLGIEVELVPASWRRAVDPDLVYERLRADPAHELAAVLVVHNETSTGVTSPIDEIRRAIDAAAHPALFLVDTISSLASIDYRPDEWGVDVTVAGSQKGLMLPPGLGFNVVSARALEAASRATLPKGYWDWAPILEANTHGRYPSTPATNLLVGLREALALLEEEGLENVFARHDRHAEATRRAVRGWGLETVCQDADACSSTVTGVVVSEPHDADAVRALILERFDMSLGAGLGKLAGRVFRIGHVGALNDLTLAGTLCGVELGLALSKVPIVRAGVAAALDYLGTTACD